MRWGEILGLIGDNGGGTSTLIKTLTGHHQPDGGRLLFEGEPVHLKVTHALSPVIETVFQELAMVNDLPVYLNLHLNKGTYSAGLSAGGSQAPVVKSWWRASSL